MSKARIQITLCNTCVRDNYGEGIFTNTDRVEDAYRQQFRQLGPSSRMPVFKQHNCFNFCELYHCVQVEGPGKTYLFKKVSDTGKIASLCEWVRQVAEGKAQELPKALKELLIETQEKAS